MKDYSFNEVTIGEIVANDYRAAALFREAGIDFCCRGYNILSEACREKGSDLTRIVHQLEQLAQTPPGKVIDFREWEIVHLCDYLVDTHHRYVKSHLPKLVYYTDKIAEVHGSLHPELMEVAILMQMVNSGFLDHTKREEEHFFPAIREAAVRVKPESRSIIANEIIHFQEDHTTVSTQMEHIRLLTNKYTFPEDACQTWKLTYRLLEEFEEDLQMHVHLENNILYPKTRQLFT